MHNTNTDSLVKEVCEEVLENWYFEPYSSDLGPDSCFFCGEQCIENNSSDLLNCKHDPDCVVVKAVKIFNSITGETKKVLIKPNPNPEVN